MEIYYIVGSWLFAAALGLYLMRARDKGDDSLK